MAVTAALGLTGLTCDDYDTAAQQAITTAVAALHESIEERHITDASGCTDVSRRRLSSSPPPARRRLSDGVSISVEISVSPDAFVFDDDGDATSAVAASIEDTLSAAVGDGSFVTTLAAAAQTHGSDIFSTDAVGATEATVVHATSPTQAPSSAEAIISTSTATAVDSAGISDAFVMMALIVAGLVICICSVCVGGLVLKAYMPVKSPTLAPPVVITVKAVRLGSDPMVAPVAQTQARQQLKTCAL